ncbi:MAG: hypothetical protein J7623_01785 [Chitinophaga sp.]|uniref:hypothetical protein n=1 Tax=Chitinophaga sp. TaxID=1869181 RepID=UPI001B1CCE1C|nr:hypothetical protein [Chitinophaga sp.]MBO9727347.1 hypothetical protein [Chitinophaga sp.]
MKKILFTGCMICVACLAGTAQTALKLKLVQVVSDKLPLPPASLEGAYNLAHSAGEQKRTVNTRQDVYNRAQEQINTVIAKIEAGAPPPSQAESADIAVDLAKKSNSFVAGSPEMQRAMRDLQDKLQNDEKFAEEFEAKSDKEKEIFLKEWNKKYNVKAPTGPVVTNDVVAKEMEMFKSLSMEMGNFQKNMETRYFQPLSKPDLSIHEALDRKEAAELKALPIIQMGEYTGADPGKEKLIRTKYFNEHMKVAKDALVKNKELWLLAQKDYLAGLARFDTKLAEIGWGDKLVNPMLRPGVGGLQKGLLELANKLVDCEHVMTYQAGTWYAASLDRP